MKFVRVLLFLGAAFFLPLSALAQVTFTNNDGTFSFNPATQELDLGVTTGDGVLGLPNPGKLTAISGLTNFGIPNNAVAFPCSPCLGTITLQTNTLQSGSLTSNVAGQTAIFNPGGSFNVAYTNGVSFSGTFSTASWTSLGNNSWLFSGTIMGGTLTVGGQTFTIATASNVQLTSTGGFTVHPAHGNVVTFSDAQGTTTFFVSPEPGTLGLFGSGMVLLGLFVRRLSARSSTSG